MDGGGATDDAFNPVVPPSPSTLRRQTGPEEDGGPEQSYKAKTCCLSVCLSSIFTSFRCLGLVGPVPCPPSRLLPLLLHLQVEKGTS